MRRMPEGLINEIRAQTDLVDLVSSYLSLNKKGNNYWGICPFHTDTNPSLSVAADKQIYKCFTCGAGGNAFTFLQNINSISFMEAVEILADKAGIDVSEYVNHTPVIKDPQKEVLYDIMEAVGQFSAYQLHSEDGKKGIEYLKPRHYSKALLETFGVGVVYEDNQITKFLSAKGFQVEDMVLADVSRNQDGIIKDVFYNRILFPIHDAYGRLIAFSGRTMDPNSKVKYINTSETKLYTKGNVIYNMHRAKDAARKEGYILVSEGVTDTIAFYKAGIEQSVSLLGVACTPTQIRLLKQCSNTVILAFDGDAAGISATYKIGKELHQNGFKVRVWRNDTGMDPDDALRQYGAESLVEGIENRLHWYDFIINFAIAQYGLESFENKQRVIKLVQSELKNADALEKSHFIGKLADITNFNSEVLISEMSVAAAQATQTQHIIGQKQVPQAKPEIMKMSLAERNILSLMLHSKQAAYQYRDQLGFMQDNLANQLALIILDAYRSASSIQVADLLSKDISQEIKDFAMQLESELYLNDFSELILEEQIEIIKNQLSDRAIATLKIEARQVQNHEDEIAKLQKAIEIQKRKREGF